MPNAQNLWHFPKKSLDTHQQDTIQWLFWNEKARQGVFLQQVTSKILEEADTFQMLRICLSCQPLKTELQMGIEPQNTF